MCSSFVVIVSSIQFRYITITINDVIIAITINDVRCRY